MDKKILILITFFVGLCSIAYELLVSTVSSYFLGDSIKQFSLIIGIYLASMGVGAYLSRFTKEKPLVRFIEVELLLGLVGALSVPFCYIYYAQSDPSGYQLFSLFLIFIIGCLTGLEIPLLTYILEEKHSEDHNMSNVLTFDYVGALFGTLLFPFVLLPFVGLYKSSIIVGLINIAVGVYTLFRFSHLIPRQGYRRLLYFFYFVVTVLLFCMLAFAQQFFTHWNQSIYKYPVVYSGHSQYQEINITQTDEEFRLYLNGAIQFSSRDEYRYHEALVHVPLMQVDSVFDVLILGGGEGLALREVLKYPELISVDVVELDPEIVRLSTTMHQLKELNENAFNSPKVKVYNEDAFLFVSTTQKQYDAILIDLPDPTNESLARLYSDFFYRQIRRILKKNGVMTTQATSPSLSKNAFWCIGETLRESGFTHIYPYNVNIPSFGNWGFMLAKNTVNFNTKLREELTLQFLENESIEHLFYMPKDEKANGVLTNTIDRPVILDYYLDHWSRLQSSQK